MKNFTFLLIVFLVFISGNCYAQSAIEWLLGADIQQSIQLDTQDSLTITFPEDSLSASVEEDGGSFAQPGKILLSGHWGGCVLDRF